MPKIRLRFAPSPTGYLHIGGLRTALFNYLIAKNLGGKLILRIEDTDQKREVKGAVKSLIDILNWSGIKFDEGPEIGGDFGPYLQSQRKNIYSKHIQQLINKGKVYYCFCAPERLDKMRQEQQIKKLPPRYDRTCRDLSDKIIKQNLKDKKSFVIRQKMPLAGEVIVNDELRGQIKFKAENLDDQVLIKSNGMPTYQFANVVDDYLMKISHVVRGEEWIPSLPKNILLYKDFGWTAPKYIHLPLMLNKGGGKLSKRQGDVAVEDFRSAGYLPESLINFCGLLGWRFSSAEKKIEENEIFSLAELVKIFIIKDISVSPAIFDNDKLDYINGYYIRQKSLDGLLKLIKPYLKNNINLAKGKINISDEYIKKIIRLEQKRIKKLSEIGELTEFFFTNAIDYSKDLLIWKKMPFGQIKINLEKIIIILENITDKNWNNNFIKNAIISYIEVANQPLGEYLWPMRAALTGRKASPDPFDVAAVLGKNISIKRIKEAIDKI
ncbi:glutamate--tRNA ligase [Candidatus Falkowbacteria bacterium CG_4_9_14_3_um_filter_36_9]|uniref:Glutamate--tRNA ligase n=1 Tax=Candidatus Falkowbacteria bacterium CG02_land_8_20_14_3_00_36_14 TaxID=1974560 RepID=A0A2M7DPM3_9BACT|nr:MAG: glutamate--tRNA ligase [Candidatus Falkowbacteria bacterium CG02_land_8_20_14_3_00_36_14]PJA10188.1 MAG: glutamate--tRNA ligase [Candidatus Falkowbacteria bacterium CG_4_10_14_0_2_um_filter_36_22]PJB19361.1 MAG: glutamate--tRNA ligase [Candidatus Falkowbacteria bacterium CG_4_9_14_3_um_filter_36_9]